jgi:hypothetical protein
LLAYRLARQRIDFCSAAQGRKPCRSCSTARRYPPPNVARAWRDAICEIYLQVDCAAEQRTDYDGFVREARFGAVTLTDTLLSPQSIRRQSLHISRFDKHYYYAGIERVGSVSILQAGSSFILRPGVGGLYHANQPYELRCDVKSRQFWIELPRQAFDTRFDSGRPPLLAHLDLRSGLGYIAMEFCGALAAQGAGLDEQTRAKLGEQFMDLLERRTRPAAGGRQERAPGAFALGSGLYGRAFERPQSFVERDSEEKRHFATLSSPTVSPYGHVGLRMVAAAATATMPRHTLFARPSDAIDHGNRLFHGVRQFVPFQQSLSRAIRAAAIRREGRFRRVESFANDSKLPNQGSAPFWNLDQSR